MTVRFALVKKSRRWPALLALMSLLATPLAFADGVAELKRFVSETQSLKADFQQEVSGRDQKSEQARGTLQLSRPGKFRWIYQKPYEQWIIGDGKRLWVYDRELAQVTSRQLDEALGSSPAALLAGKNEIERDYQLRNLGKADGLEWLEAVPKTAESGFRHFRMGFRTGNLISMVLTDNFGQTTRLSFSNIKKNPAIEAGEFLFTPPKGVDVIQQ